MTSWSQLPKVSLHEHLDGCVRASTLLELWDSTPSAPALPATDAASLQAWIAQRADSGSLLEYLRTFEYTTSVLRTAENLYRVAQEYVADLVEDGVVYGEVRWAPELSTGTGLNLGEAFEAVRDGLLAGTRQARDLGHDIEVRQILTAVRHGTLIEATAELALANRDRGVVAFDLAGPEAGHHSSRFRPVLDRLEREWFPVTIHAGEADGLASIASALVDGHAWRLGHGVRITEDVEVSPDGTRVGPLAAWVRDRGVVLETCPSSNLHTGAVRAHGDQLADHPIALLDSLGFRVTVSTDNRLMSHTTLSRELAALTDAFGFDLSVHRRLQLNAASGAFLPAAERTALAARVAAGFDR